MAGSAYARPAGTAMGLPGRPLPTPTPQGPLQAPITTQINGQTYLGAGPQASLQPGQSRSYGAGTLWGGDGSTWSPMARPGTGGNGAGSGSAEMGLEDFNFENALQRVQPALPPVPGPAVMPEHVKGSTPADSAAAEASEFGRAKDRIGRLGRGSQSSIAEEFSARGLGGSAMEGAATQGLLSDLQGQEGEVIRDQSIQNLVRQRQVEDRNYAGDVNQRGQDIGFTTTTRGQDINAADNRAQLQVPLMQLIAANRRRVRLY